MPLAVFVLFSGRLPARIAALIGALIATGVPLLIADRVAYGRWTASLWNFVKYNVVGGGDSALYGVESPTFYLRNGIINLQMALPLALVSPILLAFAGMRWVNGGDCLLRKLICLTGAAVHMLEGNVIKPPVFGLRERRPTATLHKRPSPPGLSPRQAVWALGLITAPALLWGAAISALPHKEERFLFVVYPLVSCPHKHAVFEMFE